MYRMLLTLNTGKSYTLKYSVYIHYEINEDASIKMHNKRKCKFVLSSNT